MKIKHITKIKLEEEIPVYDVINANPYNNFLVKTSTGNICSHNCFFDEISFIQNQDIEKQKEKALDMIDTAIGGMKTRFIKRGQNPTLLCLASSKRSDKSFLEVHTKKKLESEKENVIIVDEPVWNVRPADEYCGVKFYVAQGNKYLASEIIPKGADLKPYKDRGFTIIEVPIEFYAEFYENIERALCDFAGVSSSDITKYIAGYRLQAVKKKELKNPFTKDIIEVGNGPEDKTQYNDFFDMSLVDEQMKSKPLYIHLDMSLSGDRTGIAGVWIKGKKPSADGETPSKDLYYQLAFSIAVKAPRGFQVSFEKNRQFIYWLKEKGFRIKGVSSDTYQSADLKQQLIAKGYKYDIISVDRVETLDDGKTKLCKPYHYFRNTLYEERIEIYDSELLTTELLGLERNSAGRIDHPDSGQSGCFTGDTKVRLVDGRSLTFLELVDEFNSGRINYVYSFNHQTERIEPRKILKAWCTLRDQPLVRVTLDDGSWVECTHNHKFMLRDGTYKEAKDLQPQDSLMPLYTKYAERKGKPRPESAKQKMRDTYSKKIIIVSDERRAQISEQSRNSSWYTNGVEEKFIFNGNDIPEGFHKGRLNHKVASVEFLDKTADVYDITVDNNHNFALDIGVFVHNSKDVSDAVCGALWNASQNAEEFAFDYGEDIQSMVEVSSSDNSNYQKQQVMLNFQEELQKVFGAGVSAITQRSQPSNDAQKEQYKNMSYIRDGIIPF